jgi:hypothetical protein
MSAFCWLKYGIFKTHDMNNIIFRDAQWAEAIYNFKNTKEHFVGKMQPFSIIEYVESNMYVLGIQDHLFSINSLMMQ